METPGRRSRIRPIKPPKLDAVRNEINVTPLVDVCLVLLIIFMVIMPMLARGKEVPLPMTRHHAAEKDELQPIVAIDASGNVYIDKERVKDLEDLKTQVESAWTALEARPTSAQGSSSGERKVYLKAAAELEFGRVYPVVMALHEVGAVGGIDLGTNEMKDKE